MHCLRIFIWSYLHRAVETDQIYTSCLHMVETTLQPGRHQGFLLVKLGGDTPSVFFYSLRVFVRREDAVAPCSKSHELRAIHRTHHASVCKERGCCGTLRHGNVKYVGRLVVPLLEDMPDLRGAVTPFLAVEPGVAHTSGVPGCCHVSGRIRSEGQGG